MKNFGLDTMENLNRFQKLIPTDWEILTLILIGLDCQDIRLNFSASPMKPVC